MKLKRITITIREGDDLTDAQLDELLDLINASLAHVGSARNLQRAVSRAKLSHGVQLHVDY